MQHADHDTAFQAWALPHVRESYRAGNLSGQELALLTDRLATARQQPQEYGTQADVRDGHIVLKPVRDSAKLDERRRAMGLPPLAVYLRMLDSVHLGSFKR